MGESQARNRYTYFASVARKEGYEQIAGVFEEIANQEKEHAKRFYKFLEGGSLEVTVEFPAGVVGNTAENLKEAADGERYENTKMYPTFAGIARKEGFEAIAKVFENIAVSEKGHEKRYRALLANIKNGVVFKRKEPTIWRCRNCGYIHNGNSAPEICPACAHPQAYFELYYENY